MSIAQHLGWVLRALGLFADRTCDVCVVDCCCELAAKITCMLVCPALYTFATSFVVLDLFCTEQPVLWVRFVCIYSTPWINLCPVGVCQQLQLLQLLSIAGSNP